jgi:hypothetical protein
MDQMRLGIIKHINAAAADFPTRFDEPSVPIEGTPTHSLSAPSKFDTWMSNIIESIIRRFGGINDAIVYFLMYHLGFTRPLAEMLVVHLTLVENILWDLCVWFYLGRQTDVVSEIVRSIIWSFVNALNLPLGSDAEQLVARVAISIQDGLTENLWTPTVVGEVCAALQRGWTLQQILSWMQHLSRGGTYYHWPDTWSEAELEIREREEEDRENSEAGLENE